MLVQGLGLSLRPIDFGRAGLQGNVITYSETVPRAVQEYQIARAACAYALYDMKLIQHVSPHDLAVALCGVSSADPQLLKEPVPVRPLELVRPRRKTGRVS